MTLENIGFSGQEDVKVLVENNTIVQVINPQANYQVWEVVVTVGESINRYATDILMDHDGVKKNHPEYLL